MFKMLQGKNINLRVIEKEDLPVLVEWYNNPKFFDKYNPLWQTSRLEMEQKIENRNPSETRTLIIEKKDGNKIGCIMYFNVIWDGIGKLTTIGFSLIPNERRKGYGTEAAQILVDFLFLSKEIPCIQATTHINNIASQRVLEKVGFKKEGTIRKRFYIRGEWSDQHIFSILREEWKEPKILK